MDIKLRDMASYRIHCWTVLLAILGAASVLLLLVHGEQAVPLLLILLSAAAGLLVMRGHGGENASVFGLGALLMVLPACIGRWWRRCLVTTLLSGGCAGMGAALMGTSLLRQGRQLRAAYRVLTGTEESSVRSTLRTGAVLLGLLLFLCIPAAHQVAWARVPGAVCLAAALYCSMIQPMEGGIAGQLQDASPAERDSPLGEKLRRMLVRPFPRRFWLQLAICLLRPLYRHRVLGTEHVADPCGNVFVSNHGEVYGPVTMTLHFPFRCRTWVTAKMLERESAIRHMYTATLAKGYAFLSDGWKRRLARILAPMGVRILSAVDPIPVYVQSGRDLLRTMNLSVDALMERDNILIFPENPAADGADHFADRGCNTLHTGFVSLAARYYRRTGKCLTFYPVYCSKRRRTITVGEGITYDPAAPSAEEKRRIAACLHRRINDMAALP